LRLSGGRVEIKQVLLNLLINARAAVLDRPTPRRITLSAEADGPWVRLDLTDNGPGIAPELIGKIFAPFFTTKRAEQTKDTGGSGLGLTVCREILDALGGEISVESTLGVGTIFTLRLPNPKSEI
jgi:signal transduction histidine kinase